MERISRTKMVLWEIMRAAVISLPIEVCRHIGVSGKIAFEIGSNPLVAIDETEGVFWLQVTVSGIAQFRFAYSIRSHPAGQLMQVKNVRTQEIVWKRPQ